MNVNELLSNPDNRNVLYLLLLIFCIVEGLFLARRFGLDAPLEGERETKLCRLGLAIALLIGGGLRFYGLDFGLPTPYHPDELQKAHFLRSMMAEHRIDPHFGLQPPLLLYLSYFVSQLLDLFHIFERDTISRILLSGRTVSAISGTISIFLVYSIGKRISSPLTGVLAALLIAVFPLHVTNCRYMKEDALFIAFALSCMLFVLKSVDEKKLRYLYLAGLFAGFSLGAKYTGVVSFLIVLSAPFLARKRFSFVPDWRFLKHAVLAILLEPVGFVLTAPYLLQSWENIHQVLEGFGSESRHAMRGHMGLAISAASQLWMFHLGNSLLPGIGLLPLVTALVGIGVLLYCWRPKELFLIALFLLFYLPAEWANSKPPPQPDRYVMACTPILALIAAELLFLFRERFGSAGLRLYLYAGLLLVFPAIRSVQLASEIRYDTRRQMTDWLYENIPAGSRILTSGGTTYLARIPQKLQGVALRKKIGRANDHLVDRLKATGFDYILTTTLSAGRFATNVQGRPREVANALKEIDTELPLAKRISPKYGSYGFHNPVLSLYSLKGEEAEAKAEVGTLDKSDAHSAAPRESIPGKMELSHPPPWGVR